jgi:hypothetical protein
MGIIIGVIGLAVLHRVTASPRGGPAIKEASASLAKTIDRFLDPATPAIPPRKA